MKKGKLRRINTSKRNNRGITLMALVVTIIVLLILATITISTIRGKNGIVQTAVSAKESAEVKSERKIVDLSANQARNKDKYGDVSKKDLEESLLYNVGKDKTTVDYYTKGELYFVTFNDSQRMYEVTTGAYVKYIGKRENAGVIVARPKASISPTESKQVDLTLKTLEPNNVENLEYVWTQSKAEEPTNGWEQTGKLQKVTEDGAENESKTTVTSPDLTENEITEYYLWVKTTVGDNEIIECLGPYVIGKSTIQLAVYPNGGRWKGPDDHVYSGDEYYTYEGGREGDTIQVGRPLSVPAGYTIKIYDGINETTPIKTITTEKTFSGWLKKSDSQLLTEDSYTLGNEADEIRAIYADQEITLPKKDDPNYPEKDGYEIEKWVDEDGNDVDPDGDGKFIPHDDIEVKPQWTPKKYELAYNASENGGTTTQANERLATDTVVDLSTKGVAEKSGWEFIGWNTNKNATTKLNQFTMTAENSTLYAIFKKDVKVSFKDAVGTSDKTKTIYNKEKAEIDIPTIRENSGWTIAGWAKDNTNPGASVTVSKDTNKLQNVTENATYYAIYTKEITVTFNKNGGTGTEPTAQKGTISVNSNDLTNVKNAEVTMPAGTGLTREGYQFAGWNTKEDGTGENYTDKGNFSGDVTLYAKWEVKQYTLKVDPNGGKYKNSTEVTEEKQNYGTTLNLGTLNDTTGFTVTFNVDGGNEVKSQTSIRKFKNWTLQSTSNGSSLTGTTYTFGAVENNKVTANWENQSITLPEATKDGYTIDHWEDNDGNDIGNPGDDYTPDKDITIKAVYTANTYKVTLNNQSATTPGTAEYYYQYDTTKNISGKTVYYYEDANLTTPLNDGKYKNNMNGVYITVPTKTGYTFKGYYTEGETTKYIDENGLIIGDLYKNATSDITLYAKWDINKYTITYNYAANGGTGENTTKEVEYGSQIDLSLPATSPKTGWEIIGWAESANSSDKVESKQATGNITLYAIYKKDVTLTFKDAIGETPKTETVYNNEKATIRTPAIRNYTQTKDGKQIAWTAKYWTTGTNPDSEENKVNAETDIINLTDNAIYYARYSREITVEFDVNGGDEMPIDPIKGDIEVNSDDLKDEKEPDLDMPTETPTKEGYDFNGWNTDPNGDDHGTGTHYDPGSETPGEGGSGTFGDDERLYAEWVIHQYTLKVNPNGGTWDGSTEVSTRKQDFNTTLTLGNPTPKTETFKVTFDATTNGGSTGTASLDSNNVFKKWDLQAGAKGTITVENNNTYKYGASDDTATASYEHEEITLPKATKTGYGFSGWYTKAQGGEYVGTTGTKYTPEAIITLYAHFSAEKHKVTYDYKTNGGTSGPTATPEVGYDDAIDLTPTATKVVNGVTWNFVGWSKTQNATEAETEIIMEGSDITVYAIFSTPVKVTYKDAAGTTTRNVNMYNKDSATDKTPAISTYKDGQNVTWNIVGWTTSTAKDAIKEVDNEGTITLTNTNTTVDNGKYTKDYYAIYKKDITVSFDLNGGSGTKPTSIPGTVTVNSSNLNDVNEDTVSMPGVNPEPTKEGYTFNGWNTKQDGTGTHYDKDKNGSFGGDATLYAEWTRNSYEITIDPNGGKLNGSTEIIKETKSFESEISLGTPVGQTFTVTFDTEGTAAESQTVTQSFDKWVVTEGKGTVSGNKFTVGAGKGTVTATYNNATITLPNTTKEGYTIDHWEDEDGEDIGKPGEEYTPTGDITVTPKWTINSYTVTINPNGGKWNNTTSPTTKKQDYNTTLDLNTPTVPAGYVITLENNDGTGTKSTVNTTKTFTGWNVEGAGSVTGPNNTYTFKANDDTVTAQYKNDEVTLTSPTREGYTFDGWYSDSEGGERVDNNGRYTATEPKTIYGHWSINKYKLTIDANGGTYTGTNPINGDYNKEIEITGINAPAGTSYKVTFNTTGGNSIDPITPTMSFGSFSKTSGVGTINGNKFTFGAGDATIKANWNVDNITLPDASRDGYTFNGWYKEVGLTNKVGNAGDPYKSTETTTLYAKWDVVTYHITYDLNGGTADTIDNYDVEDGDITLPQPTKPGYTFDGWTGDNGNTPEKEVTIPAGSTGNKDYTANYTANKFTVKFNKNATDATGTMVDQEFIYDAEQTLNENKFTRTGYHFTGWNRKENGTGDSYTDKQQHVKNLATSGTVNLYAQWEKNQYTLKVKPNGGKWNTEEEDTEITQDYESTINLGNATPKVSQYTVTLNGNGYAAANGSVTANVTSSWTLEGAGSLTGTTYKFGAGNATVTANYTTESKKLPTPEREGYGFTGWYKDSACTTKIADGGKEYTPTKNETLFAGWKAGVYTVTYNYAYNGGTNASKTSDTVSYGENIDLSVTAEKIVDGDTWTFVGWAKDADKDGHTGLSSLTMGTSSVTLYAIYSKNVTLTFIDYNGTTKTTRNESKTIYNKEKAEITAPAINTYTGWTPRYWTTGTAADSEENKVNAGAKISNLTKNATYYARYYKQITLTFDLNGGSGDVPGDIKKNVEVNSYNVNTKKEPSVTMPTVETTKEGHSFAGWKTEDGHEYNDKGTGTFGKNETLKAQWTKNEYTLTVNPNGGKYNNSTGNTEVKQEYDSTINLGTLANKNGATITFNGNGGSTPTSQTVVETFKNWTKTSGAGTLTGNTFKFGAGNAVVTANWENQGITLPTPDWNGYTFDGWYTDDEGGTKVNPDQDGKYRPTTSTELFAHWEENTYAIQYDLKGGSLAQGKTNPAEYTVNTATFTLNNPSKTGYTFTGWTGSNGNTPQTTVTVTKGTIGDKTYTANYTPKKYTLTVKHYLENANDTKYTLVDTTTTQNIDYDTELTLANYAIPVENGTYDYASKTASTDGAASAKITKLTMGEGATVALYYKRNTAVLTLEKGNYVASVTGNGTYKVGASITIDATLSANATGYTNSWVNWTNNNTQYTATKNATITMPATALTLKANGTRTINNYTIEYDLDGGKLPSGKTNPGSYTVETTTFTLNNPEKQGYIFAGWTGSNGTTKQTTVTIAKGTTGNKSYKANWTTEGTITAYKVEHYQMNLSGSGYALKDTQNLTSETDSNVTATAKTYDGFTYDSTITGTVASGKVKPDGSLVLKLYYKRNQYKYTVVKGTGTTLLSGNTASNASVYYGTTINLKAKANDGYTWSKWTSSKTDLVGHQTNANTSITMPAGDLTMTSTAIANSYTIHFDKNDSGATGSMNDMPMTYDKAKNLTENAFTKIGYNFDKWNTESNGSGTSYSDKESVINLAVSGTVTLFAQWKEKGDTPYKVEHYLMNTSGNYPSTATDVDNLEGTTGQELTLANLKRTEAKYNVANGIVYDHGTVGGSTVTKTTIAADGSRVIKLYYKRNQYQYTVSAGKGTTLSSGNTATAKLYYGATITLKATANTGYTWSKWTSSNTNLVAHQPNSNSSITMPAGNLTMTATATANELVFNGKTINKTYSTTAQTDSIGVATNGTGSYTYEITEGNSETNFAIDGTTLNIKAGLAAGTYNLTVKVTDNGSGKTATASYQIIIGQKGLGTPTVSIDTDGKVTWTSVDNASGYQISFDNGATWQTATSGSKTIDTSTTGDKKVLVRATTSDSNYQNPGPTGEKSVTVYSLTLTTGAGIGSVTGVGNYVSGKTVNISATVNTGYTWSKWTVTSGNTPANVNNINTTVTITKNTTLKANTTANELTFYEKTINKTYSTSAQTDTISAATNGTGSYTYTITAGNTNNYFSITNGTTLNIASKTPVGTYNLTIRAKDNGSNVTKNATYTVVIGKQKVNAPTNLNVTTAGIVTWNASNNATGYQISIDGENWTNNATSGMDYLSTITATTGERTVYVRALNSDSNYDSPSNSVTKKVTVYQMTFNVSPTAGGSVSDTGYKVISGVTYTTNNNKLSVKSGTTTLKTVTATANTGFGFTSWSSTSGTVSKAITITATFDGTELTFGNKEITKTYSTSAQTDTINVATNGTGNYTYSITSGNTNNNFSITNGTTLNIKAGLAVGEYSLTVRATDTVSGKIKDATYTIVINKQKLNAPTNVKISTAGIVTWTASSNAPSGTTYDISIDGTNWTQNVTSGKDFLSTIIAVTGERTVYIRAKSSNSNYGSPSDNASAKVNVYTVTFESNSSTMGTVNETTYKVISGATYTSSSNVLTIKGVTTGTTTKNLKQVTATAKTGYNFGSWSTSSGTITANKKITANFVNGTSTPYKVEHYQMKLDGTSYELVSSDTEDLTGTTGDTANATAKTYEGFKYNSTKSISSGAIKADGTLVLKMYYDRQKYAYTVTAGTGTTLSSGNTASGQIYYGATINLKATANTGYTWSKWTSNNAKVEDQNSATATVTMPASALTMTATATANPLTFTGKTITKTYSPSAQTYTISAATNGTGDYKYEITAGNTNSNFSISGTTLNIKAGLAVGTYNLTIKATDNTSKVTANASYTVKIEKANITGKVTITGTNTYGQKLTASVSDLNPSSGVTLKYTWYSADNTSMTGGTKLSGPNTSNEYTVGTGLVGKYIYVVVTATKTNYNDKEFKDVTDAGNNGTATVAKANINPTVSMSGYTYGGTKSTPGVNGNTGSGTVTYYYNTTNSNSNGTAWTTVTNATTLNAGDYYMYAVVGETTNYNGKTTPAVKFTIAKATPTVTVTLSGTTTWGQTLTAKASNTGNGTSYTYQWYYTTTSGATSGTAISGATSSTYTVDKAYVGKYVGCTATVATTTNYNSASKGTAGTSTIAKQNLSVTKTDYNATYDGAEHGVVVKVTSSEWNGKTIVSGTSTSYGTTVTSNGAKNTNYTLSPKYKNYTTSKTVYFKITGGDYYNDYTGTGTVAISKQTVNPPTNVQVGTDGKVTWTNSSNATGYQISIDGQTWTSNVTSGVNYLSTITASTGNRTVYVRAVNSDTTNYNTPSSNVTKSVTVYSVTLAKGTGISAVTGAGNYISGATVTLGATVSTGYTWSKWTQTSGGSQVSTTNAYSSTISGNWAYTANATVSTSNKVTLTLKKDGSNSTELNGYKVYISNSSTSNSKSWNGTTTNENTMVISGAMTPGTTYYVWVGKDANHKTADSDMAYSGVSFTGGATATATINFYTLTVALSNSTAKVNGTSISNNGTVVVLGGTGTASTSYAHAIQATASTGCEFSSWSSSSSSTVITSKSTASTTVKVAAAATITAISKENNYAEYNGNTLVKYYETLYEALNGATTGRTIKPLKNVTDTSTSNPKVASSKTLTFDLDGKTVTMSKQITNDGTLTITGTGKITNSAADTISNSGTFTKSGESTIENTSTSGRTISNSGTATFSAGTIIANNTAIRNNTSGKIIASGATITSTSNYAISNAGTANTKASPAVKVTGGTIISTNSYGIDSSSTGMIYVTGGEINGYIGIWNSSTGTLEIEGGTITGTSKLYGVYGGPGTVNISGSSTEVRGEYAVFTSSGTVTVTGGTIEGTYAITSDGTATVNISGASTHIKGTQRGLSNSNSSGSTTVTITGGTIEANGTNGTGIGLSGTSTLNISGSSTNIIGVSSGISIGGKGNNGVTATISGGTITATSNTGSAVYNYGTTTITGGTIQSSNYFGISNYGTINVTGGNISGGKDGIWNPSGTLTLGSNDGNVSQTVPSVTGTERGVNNTSGTFNFYDGIIKGKYTDSRGYSINGTVSDTPTGYGVAKTIEDSVEIATLGKKYSIVFNKNATDATGTMSNLEMIVNVPKNLTKNAFTRVGYKFIGWSTLPTGESMYADEGEVDFFPTSTENSIILYAIWEQKDVMITYDNNYSGPKLDGATWTSNGLSFDGTDDWVNLGPQNFDKFTLETKVSLNALSGNQQHIISNVETGGICLAVSNTGNPQLIAYIDGTGYVTVTGPNVLQTNRTYDIVGTYDGSTLKLYVDGILVASESISGTIKKPNYSTVMALGANPYGEVVEEAFLNGTIYSARIYNRTLSATEVTQNYNNNISYDGLVKNIDVNNQNINQVTIKKPYAGTLATLFTPERTKYRFDGWYTEPEGGTKVTDSTSVPAEETTYYAHWTKSAVEITFDDNYTGPELHGAVWSDEGLEFDGDDWANWGRLDLQKFTLEARVSINEMTGASQHIISNVETGGICLAVSSTGNPQVIAYIDGTGYVTVSGPNVLQANRAYDIVGTYDGSTLKLYVDGVLVASESISGTIKKPNYSTVMALGANPYVEVVEEEFLNGTIYSARIYNKALSNSRVKHNYSSPENPFYDGLVKNIDVTNQEMTQLKIEKEQGETLGTLITPQRLGYTFDGWYTAASGGTKVTDTTVVPTSNTTYYAHWTANSYKLVKMSGNNLISNGNFSTYTTINAETKTANGVTHTWDKSLNGIPGNTSKTYQATGWTTGSNLGVPVPEIGYHAHMRIIDGNNVFRFKTNENYAGQTKANVSGGVTVGADGTVTTDRWSGINQTIAGTKLTAGKTYAITMDVYRVSGDSYITAALYYATSGNTSLHFENSEERTNIFNPTGTGRWETLTCTFTLASGYLNSKDSRIYIYGHYAGADHPGEMYVDNVRLEEVTVSNKNYNTEYTSSELADPTSSGTTFNGWFNNSSFSSKLKTSDKFDSTNATFQDLYTAGSLAKIYANTTSTTYTVTYNANGGSGTMAQSTVSYGSEFQTRPNTFTKTGYHFVGWNEKADGTGTAWKTSGVTSPWTWTYTKNITLYAQWEENILTLQYLPGGADKKSGTAITNQNTVLLTQTFKWSDTTSFSEWGLDNYGTTSTSVPITKTGYHATGYWHVNSAGASKKIEQDATYAGTQPMANAMGVLNNLKTGNVTVKLYAGWTINQLFIQIHMNGGSLASSHGSTISTSGSYITVSGSKAVHTINYGGSLGSDGLVDYNNSSYVNITKSNCKPKQDAEYNTKADGTGTSFNENTAYAASKFADLSTGNKTITLYLNWGAGKNDGHSHTRGSSPQASKSSGWNFKNFRIQKYWFHNGFTCTVGHWHRTVDSSGNYLDSYAIQCVYCGYTYIEIYGKDSSPTYWCPNSGNDNGCGNIPTGR